MANWQDTIDHEMIAKAFEAAQKNMTPEQLIGSTFRGEIVDHVELTSDLDNAINVVFPQVFKTNLNALNTLEKMERLYAAWAYDKNIRKAGWKVTLD